MREQDRQYFVQSFANIADEVEGTIRSFPGGMYGKTCIAVTADDLPTAMKVVTQAIRSRVNDMYEELCDLCDDTPEKTYTEVHQRHDTLHTFIDNTSRVRMDGMGMGVVIYWPDVEFTREQEIDLLYPEDEDEDEEY